MPSTNFSDFFGKKIRSKNDVKMHVGSPGSGEVKTLPAGKPSPKIDSYIKQKGARWYQLKPKAKDVHYYVKFSDNFDIVPPNAKDKSSYFGSLFNQAKDFIENTGETVQKNAGFLGSGFKKSVSNIGGDLWNIGKGLKKGLFAIGGILVLIIIIKIINRT